MLELTSKQVAGSIRRFRDLAGDVRSATARTFDRRLGFFYAFCEGDEVFSRIHSELLEMPSVNPGSWIGESEHLAFPPEEEERIPLMYRLLQAFRKKEVAWTDFADRFFGRPGSSIVAYFPAVAGTVAEPLMRDLLRRLKDIETSLPMEENVPVSSSILRLFPGGPKVVSPSRKITPGISPVSRPYSKAVAAAFAALRKKIGTDSTDQNNDLELLAAAETEAGSMLHRGIVVGTLLRGLTIAAPSASNIAVILKAVG